MSFFKNWFKFWIKYLTLNQIPKSHIITHNKTNIINTNKTHHLLIKFNKTQHWNFGGGDGYAKEEVSGGRDNKIK